MPAPFNAGIGLRSAPKDAAPQNPISAPGRDRRPSSAAVVVRHVRDWCAVAAAVAFAAVPHAAAGAEPQSSAVPIGSVDGVPAWGHVLNGLGDVGGWVELPGPNGNPTFRPIVAWSGRDVDYVGLIEGTTSGAVAGLNDRRQVAIVYSFPGDVARSYLYDGSGPPQPIALPAGFTSASLTAINNLGHVAGTATSATQVGLAAQPFVYADGVMSVLPLPAGSLRGFATDFNDRGDVLGRYFMPAGSGFTNHVAVWSGGTVTELAPPPGWTQVEPAAINAHGHVLGRVHLLREDGKTLARRPVIYRDGVPTVLETPFGTADPVHDMNDAGHIVGSGLSTFGYGFVYADGTRTDLNRLVSLPDGYFITQGLEINNAGRILARARNTAGDFRHYLLTPVPEPGSAACVALVGAAALQRRRRTR